MVTAEAWVAALVRIQSLAWELPHAMVMAKNKKKKLSIFLMPFITLNLIIVSSLFFKIISSNILGSL